jgi:hypothetical protein
MPRSTQPEPLPAEAGFAVFEAHLYTHDPPVANCPYCFPPSGPLPEPPGRSPFEVLGEITLTDPRRKRCA